jgi:Uma2 family endonuclease
MDGVMNVTLGQPVMTREEFFPWAEAQDERYEFDGFAPVAMTGGTIGHSDISGNTRTALALRLRGTGCRPIGPDAGVATVGDTVRYPDTLITCAATSSRDRLVPGVVVVFEVLSPTSGYIDRVIKLREYQAVPSIRRYVILEYTAIGATVLERATPDEPWSATALASGDVLRIPEVGIELPLGELYENVDFFESGSGRAAP